MVFPPAPRSPPATLVSHHVVVDLGEVMTSDKTGDLERHLLASATKTCPSGQFHHHLTAFFWHVGTRFSATQN